MSQLQEKKIRRADLPMKLVMPLSTGILVFGFTGYLTLPHGTPVFYLLTHFGALGLLGFIGGGLGICARKKGRNYWTAFLVGSLLPIAAGILAVAFPSSQLSCHESIGLASAILIFIIYLPVKGKPRPPAF